MAEQAHVSHEVHAHPNYIKVYWTLLALLTVSVIGPMFGIKAVTIITAFGVAAYKAYLVAKNFMLLFFAGTAPDVMKSEGTGWVKPSWLDGSAHAAPGAQGSEHAPAH